MRTSEGSRARPVRFVLLGLALLCGGCDADAGDVEARRRVVLDEAQASIEAELQGMLSRAWAALDAVAAEPPDADETARFDRLESVRATHDVDGLDV